MDKLIIAEKPSVALRIAIALGGSSQKREVLNGVSYFVIDEVNSKTYIAPAVGHIFTMHQVGNKGGYPVLDVEWAPSYKVSSALYYTKKYFDVFEQLSKKCGIFINACDYDVEGTVIGTNIINFIAHGVENAKRMKFSTTTPSDLRDAYENLLPLDINNFYAGETRHILDWLWGINLSRALTSALQTGKPLSIGRVQGPTLAILANREIEIKEFVPKPYWLIYVLAKGVKFSNARGEIFDKGIADSAYSETERNKSNAVIESIEEKEAYMSPYPPFDLTSLQLEASRVFGLDPSTTLAIAQTLYEHAYISYPRTSSQKLPFSIPLQRIIGDLSKNPAYKESAEILIREKRFKPHEGQKTDEAHPAIYPTGIMPKGLNAMESKLYDLITRRFLACFGPFAKLSKSRILMKVGSEAYVATGTRILEKGWMSIYGYIDLKEAILPEFSKGAIKISKIGMSEETTKPPKRYTKAMLIAELEKRKLGTKSTRAAIVDTLFKRNYIEGYSIRVTSFGMTVYNALKKYAEMIISEDTTRKLEEDMEAIAEGRKEEAFVINEGKQLLLQALELFNKNKPSIGKEMKESMAESEIVLGKCPIDGGNLVVRHSKSGKIFASCSNYPKCKAIYPLPQHAKIVPTGKVCEYCHTPIIKVFKGGKVFEMDLDPNCITKKSWNKKNVEEEGKEKGGEGKKVRKTKRANVKKAKKEKNSKVGNDVSA